MQIKGPAKEVYQKLLKEAQSDPNILGFVLEGSRGKGLGTSHSDYDIHIIVKDDSASEYEEKLSPYDNRADFDLTIMDLSDFREYALFGTDSWGYAYEFAYVKDLLNKTGGEIQQLIDEKSRIPEEVVFDFIYQALDGYVNSVFRSLKAHRDRNMVGYRLEAASSINPLLYAMFAIHDRRVAPYHKYLEWELVERPLSKFVWGSEELIRLLLSILETGDYKAQQYILREVEKVFRKEGYGQMFDEWEGDDKWAMNYKPTPDV